METQEKSRRPGIIMAHASWSIILVSVLLGSPLRTAGLGIVADLIAIGAILAALVLSGAALISIKWYGRKAILIPALVGLLLSSFSVLIFLTNMLAGIERGRAMRGSEVGGIHLSPPNRPVDLQAGPSRTWRPVPK